MPRIRFDKVLKRKKISKYELARTLGYPYRSINKLFRPDYNPRFRTLAEHAKKLGVRVAYLIEE